jgi:hypothetical protein
MKTALILLMAISSFSGFTQKQGICGRILWLAGNQMPGPNAKPTPALGIQREIHVYELTSIKDTEQEEVFFKNIRTKLVLKTLSQPDGSFKIKLPAGKYTVFVKEPRGLFANQFDQESMINPVLVQEKRFSVIDITVNYQAAY